MPGSEYQFRSQLGSPTLARINERCLGGRLFVHDSCDLCNADMGAAERNGMPISSRKAFVCPQIMRLREWRALQRD